MSALSEVLSDLFYILIFRTDVPCACSMALLLGVSSRGDENSGNNVTEPTQGHKMQIYVKLHSHPRTTPELPQIYPGATPELPLSYP